MPTDDILCGACGHSIMNHQEGEDAPDIWPCDLCECNCYTEDREDSQGEGEHQARVVPFDRRRR